MMADTKMDPVDAWIGVVVLFVGYPLAVLYGGWITVKLWAWFVLPTFDGAPALTWAAAVGLQLLVMHVRPGYPPSKQPHETHPAVYGRMLGYWFFVPTMTLIAATAIHAWFQ